VIVAVANRSQKVGIGMSPLVRCRLLVFGVRAQHALSPCLCPWNLTVKALHLRVQIVDDVIIVVTAVVIIVVILERCWAAPVSEQNGAIRVA